METFETLPLIESWISHLSIMLACIEIETLETHVSKFTSLGFSWFSQWCRVPLLWAPDLIKDTRLGVWECTFEVPRFYVWLVSGLEHYCFSIELGRIIPTDSYLSEGLKPPTRWGIRMYFFDVRTESVCDMTRKNSVDVLNVIFRSPICIHRCWWWCSALKTYLHIFTMRVSMKIIS